MPTHNFIGSTSTWGYNILALAASQILSPVCHFGGSRKKPDQGAQPVLTNLLRFARGLDHVIRTGWERAGVELPPHTLILLGKTLGPHSHFQMTARSVTASHAFHHDIDARDQRTAHDNQGRNSKIEDVPTYYSQSSRPQKPIDPRFHDRRPQRAGLRRAGDPRFATQPAPLEPAHHASQHLPANRSAANAPPDPTNPHVEPDRHRIRHNLPNLETRCPHHAPRA
ncbi:hypothetical protein BD410DRAFT_825640 [Rickenella mellea]|uniref:Uncharacterized protein n=1 Tax=Rickenella mellea TaxID=50990 RepID=A0A4Y7QGA7_9AGAM|nr:hypothetical protein BD410DRAFT_825640 [Rickenella mellea]